jgi:hypothetical protein
MHMVHIFMCRIYVQLEIQEDSRNLNCVTREGLEMRTLAVYKCDSITEDTSSDTIMQYDSCLGCVVKIKMLQTIVSRKIKTCEI